MITAEQAREMTDESECANAVRTVLKAIEKNIKRCAQSGMDMVKYELPSYYSGMELAYIVSKLRKLGYMVNVNQKEVREHALDMFPMLAYVIVIEW